MRVEMEEITHMLLHALTEETLGGRMDHVKSQEEAYRILQELPYFTLSMEEFRRGIAVIREQQ